MATPDPPKLKDLLRQQEELRKAVEAARNRWTEATDELVRASEERRRAEEAWSRSEENPRPWSIVNRYHKAVDDHKKALNKFERLSAELREPDPTGPPTP